MSTTHQIRLDKNKIAKRYIYRSVKRLFDFIASLAGVIVLSPLFLYIAYRIKKEDHGPVLYTQDRVGRHGKIFKVYKFRSMIVDADKKLEELKDQNEVDGPMFKMKEDPRITKIGKFIRKYSLDELPQLFNVLKGDMSLVGPRPPLPSEVAEYSDYDKQRLYVTPGCTGLWQATVRNSAGFDEMVELDLKYIQKSGFFYDLGLIFLTVKIMAFPNDAY
ncbi:undecaprenyl-phosphate beta-glucosephosphotransferase [Ligilactobacillus hayakitensis DSM 18933 = JCM 14209]|uniref:Undecaprenyl-phosphate beta-glucosephosphotransferase n=1 Tax=Ligilactobacillus hayakitensis DSM 18933 = JCM 14209 TaxID=1423755 RepID=A0A0R1X121_9LACO|nr:sugar transferase [Ligilactobacillus hayakitensis]KRM20076.1 undecaprenyl-phosphate beta-glucosephosphotransferase [Ligilactobacillus hayakitensis DSM 18933 = JCM 14209]